MSLQPWLTPIWDGLCTRIETQRFPHATRRAGHATQTRPPSVTAASRPAVGTHTSDARQPFEAAPASSVAAQQRWPTRPHAPGPAAGSSIAQPSEHTSASSVEKSARRIGQNLTSSVAPP